MFDLAKYPEIFSQWDSDKNSVDPSVIASKESKFSWKCDIHKSHKWVTSVKQRLKGQGCPYCANKKVCETNSLENNFPNIAKLWHASKNEAKSPADYVYGSAYKAWWQCDKNASHIWQGKIRALSLDGKSCPHCEKKYF